MFRCNLYVSLIVYFKWIIKFYIKSSFSLDFKEFIGECNSWYRGFNFVRILINEHSNS